MALKEFLRPAEYFKNGFIGITQNDVPDQPILLEARKPQNGRYAMFDTANIDKDISGLPYDIVGHRIEYHEYIPEEFGILYYPSTVANINESIALKEGLEASSIVIAQGGQDIKRIRNIVVPDFPDAAYYGGIDQLRDAANTQTLEALDSYEHTIFDLGICRGLDIHGPQLLEEANEKRHKPQNGKTVTYHQVEATQEAGNIIYAQSRFMIPGNHHLRMTQAPEGWIPALFDPQDGTLEAAIRRDEEETETGLLIKGHVEKFQRRNQKKREIMGNIHGLIYKHRERYSPRSVIFQSASLAS